MQINRCSKSARQLIGILATLAFGSAAVAQAPVRAKAIPEPVLYRHFLNHVAAFQKQADLLDSQDSNGNPFRYYFQSKLGLSLREMEQIQAIALQYDTALQENRNEARRIVVVFRAANFPSGSLVVGTVPPPPPPELKTLHKQRVALTVAAREALQKILSAQSFAAVDSYVHTRVAADTSVVAVTH